MAQASVKQRKRTRSPVVDTARERRLGWFAGSAAIATMLLTLAAVPVAAGGGSIALTSKGDQALLLAIGRSGDAQLYAMWMRVASVVSLGVVALFIYHAIRGRNPSHWRLVPIIGLCAFCIVAISTTVGFFEVRSVADHFVASGPRTLTRASRLLAEQRDRGPLAVVDIGQVLGAVAFGIWVSLTAYESMRVGLLTRFLGVFGICGGIATVIGNPVGPALFLAWSGSLGLLALGYWPGGRPRAWDAGRAEPWDEVDGAAPLRGPTGA